ncbi:MAG: hypothetical protein Q8W44_09175 [Candidatus Palauibacterales bacterium]|nr:hypothetical protein [Candidatus Palauibacterales bacterium]
MDASNASSASSAASAPARRILLSAAGLAAGIAVGLALAGPTETLLGVMFVLPVVGVAAGLALGGAQLASEVREHVHAALWTTGTAVGLALGLTGGTVLVEAVGLEGGRLPADLAALLLVGSLAGAGVGLAKWVALRAGAAPPVPAGRWVAGEALALATGALLGGMLCYLALGTIRSVPAIVLIAVAGGMAEGLIFDRNWRAAAASTD